MRTDLEVGDDVRDIISKALRVPLERVTPDARLDELGAESLDVIEIVFNLEEKFDISIPFKAEEGARLTKPDKGETADAEFSTIGDVIAVVKRLVEEKVSR
jgi:acyl carrier protein